MMDNATGTTNGVFGEIRYPDRKPGVKKGMWLGVTVILLTFGVMGTWGSLVPLASAVVAQGQVVVAGKNKQVQHLAGGTVGVIRVHDGDVVEKGDILIELEDAEAKLRYMVTRLGYFSALATKERLAAEKNNLFEFEFSELLLKEAEKDPSVKKILDNERSLFRARRTENNGQIIVLRQKIVQLQEQIYGFESEQNATRMQLEIATDELKVLRKLLKDGYTTRTRVSGVQREHAQLVGNMGKITSNIARTRANMSEAKLQILQLTKQFRAQVTEEFQKVQERSFDLREKYGSAREKVERLRIRAPQGGVIENSKVHTVGGVITAGETIMDIVPQDERLIVEARVRPIDIDQIKVGQSSQIRITALDQRTTPQLTGKVLFRSADSQTDARTGEAHFIVKVELIKDARSKDALKRLQPGMPAELMINTGERTALAYLVKPIYESMNRAMREQ